MDNKSVFSPHHSSPHTDFSALPSQIVLPKTATGIHSCSYVATYEGILACSSRCGHLSFYSTETMELLHVIYPTAFNSKASHKQSHRSGDPSSSDTTHPVKSITFLHGGNRVIIHHQDGSLSLVEVELSQQSRHPPPQVKKHAILQRFMRVSRATGEGEVEVVAIANDDSMFAIRQSHLLSFFVITPTARASPSHVSPTGGLEATRTVTFSLQTHLSVFLPQSQCDLRSEDLTSKARLGRYLEANQPISVTPTRTLIQRCGPVTGAEEEHLQVTVLGGVGETLSPEKDPSTQQFILAASLPVSSAIYMPDPPPGSHRPCLLLHTCFSLGKVLSSVTGAGIIATVDPEDVLRVIDTSLLHSAMLPVLRELTLSARNCLPSEREDLEVWENIKSLREAQFISRHLFSHTTLVGRACVGTFRMRALSGKEGRVKYAMAISHRVEGEGGERAEESRGISVFISRSERESRGGGSASGASLYEVLL